MDCNYRVSIKGIAQNSNGKYLLIKENNGLWEIPGGGLEYGENPHEALKREVLEEMGLILKFISESPIMILNTVDLLGKPILNICYSVQFEHLNFIPSKECKEINFFKPAEMLDLKAYPNVKKLGLLLNKREKSVFSFNL